MTASAPRPAFDPTLYITLFADASYCPNTQAYGWCWWLKHGSPPETKVGVGGGTRIRGSSQAETEALRAGLAFVRDTLGPVLQGKRVVVQSDCLGALEAIRPELAGLRAQGAAQAYTKHVRGHRGNVTPRNAVNTLCDRLAYREMAARRAKAPPSSTPPPSRPTRPSAPRPRRPF